LTATKEKTAKQFPESQISIKVKVNKEEIAWKNSQSNLRQNSSSYLPTDRNLTVDSSSNSADASDSNSNSSQLYSYSSNSYS
jgi:hypothetical protein